MSQSNKVLFVGVVAYPRSYLNTLYLLLRLPLGVAYFIPILVLVLVVSWAMCKFERVLVNTLLKEDIPRVERVDTSRQAESSLGTEDRLLICARLWLKAHLSDRLTWTGILYLLLKFPIGIAAFVMVVVLISVTGSLLGAPAYYWVDEGLDLETWQVDVLWQAVILTLVGIPALFISLHLMNGSARTSGRVARLMLGKMH